MLPPLHLPPYLSVPSSSSLVLFSPWSNKRVPISQFYGFPVKAHYLECHFPDDLKKCVCACMHVTKTEGKGGGWVAGKCVCVCPKCIYLCELGCVAVRHKRHGAAERSSFSATSHSISSRSQQGFLRWFIWDLSGIFHTYKTPPLTSLRSPFGWEETFSSALDHCQPVNQSQIQIKRAQQGFIELRRPVYKPKGYTVMTPRSFGSLI